MPKLTAQQIYEQTHGSRRKIVGTYFGAEPKLKTYLIHYNFDGNGSCTVMAKDENDAREKFYQGEFTNDVEDGTNYEFYDATEEVKQ